MIISHYLTLKSLMLLVKIILSMTCTFKFTYVDCFLNEKNVKDLAKKPKTLIVTPPTLTRPNPFAGDPRDFLPWLNATEVFLAQIPSIEERILALFELTSGEARALIEAFLFEPKTLATLNAALKELKEQAI